MPAKKIKSTVVIEMVAAGLRPLLEAETLSQFAIGDYLVPLNLTSALYAKLAQQVNYAVSTLKSYETVATEFPAERRCEGLAWGVYKNLARVSNEDSWQDKFLAEHPNSTAGEAERAANLKIRADRGRRTGSQRDVYRDTAVVDTMSATLEVQPGSGLGKVILTGPKAAVFRHNEFAGTFEIEFKFAA